MLRFALSAVTTIRSAFQWSVCVVRRDESLAKISAVELGARPGPPPLSQLPASVLEDR